MNKEKLEKMQKLTNNKIQRIEAELQSLPSGKILCLNNGKYTQWFQVENGEKKYIPKKEIEFAKKLCYKQYLSSKLQDLQADRNALVKSLECYADYESKEKRFLNNEKYRDILKHTISTVADDLEVWRNEQYTKNPYNPGGLKYHSISGNVLRSKSELIIDQLLFMKQIPYRYECGLAVGDNIIYPDFTIRHPETGEYFYWEHFGMMDSPNYMENAITKIHLYCAHGYIPSINLITTFETSNCPFDATKAENILLQYFKN